MSERRQDDIDHMFQKAEKPKIQIDEIPKITKIASILDNTIQGKHALFIGTQLTRQLECKFQVVVSNDFYNNFKQVVQHTQETLSAIVTEAQVYLDENNIDTDIEPVLSGKVEQIIDLFNRDSKGEEKLSNRLIETVKLITPDILVIGVPLFREREDVGAENFGSYVMKFLREREMTASVLLVSEKVRELRDSILGVVTVNQQPASIVTLTKRAISISKDSTKIKILGIVDDATVETVARVEQENDVDSLLDLDAARSKLTSQMTETLESLEVTSVDNFSLDHQVKSGKVASVVATTVEEENPGLVVVRSVGDLSENLDPVAEQITRSALSKGYPVLIVWN